MVGHQKGVTAFSEPGILEIPGLFGLYQKVLGAPDVPFYSYFFPDARTQVNAGLGLAESLADAEKKMARAPEGKVSFLGKQIKSYFPRVERAKWRELPAPKRMAAETP